MEPDRLRYQLDCVGVGEQPRILLVVLDDEIDDDLFILLRARFTSSIL